MVINFAQHFQPNFNVIEKARNERKVKSLLQSEMNYNE
jgi:hypothetical protein